MVGKKVEQQSLLYFYLVAKEGKKAKGLKVYSIFEFRNEYEIARSVYHDLRGTGNYQGIYEINAGLRGINGLIFIAD